MFESILGSSSTSGLDYLNAGVLAVSGIIIGIIMAITYMKTTKVFSKNFIITLAILPLLVTVAILMVNGNLGLSFSSCNWISPWKRFYYFCNCCYTNGLFTYGCI